MVYVEKEMVYQSLERDEQRGESARRGRGHLGVKRKTASRFGAAIEQFQATFVRIKWVLTPFVLATLVACADKGPPPSATTTMVDEPPAVQREFRAVWVATVANIDWPSKRDLTTEQQQAEMRVILNRAQELKLNAIVLQVRTSADALYASPIEPWSEYLTGEQGKAPQPFYDPLELWVREAHQRGIEVHAWFNPYRARHTQAKTPNARNHVANTMPHAVKSYGGFLWMDPGEAAASKQTLDVILDVVRRYDIDGVHIDDYFYPYPVPVPGSETPPASPDDTPAPRAELPFPDDAAWSAYVAGGGKLARADWRRQNVNILIEQIYNGIKREKPHVKFGISPFGIGKPDKRPPGIAGFSQYDKLFADAELWFANGWLDYFTPQLYWPIGQKAQSYTTLLDYWANENPKGRHLWPGIYTSRINSTDKSWEPPEIVNQISETRMRARANPALRGHVHFSMVALTQNRRGINDALKAAHYGVPALVPASPWLSATPPAPPKPRVLRRAGKVVVEVETKASDGVFTHVVHARQRGQWQTWLMPAKGNGADVAIEQFEWTHDSLPERVLWSWVDRFGNESARVSIGLQELQDAVSKRQ
jgi:uncharacterized lipoprotein YddW (UPF0748 family)